MMKKLNILIEHLQKLSNKKIILVESDDFDIDKIDIDISGVFIPRRLEGRKEQLVKERLRELNITKIYSDGSVDIDGDVDLSNLDLTKLPIKFNKVTGDFDCSDNQLTSLKGCPKKVVEGSFNCARNQLFSLEGCPVEVEDFYCNNNNLISLEGCPVKVRGNFWCRGNPKKFIEAQVKELCDVNHYMSV